MSNFDHQSESNQINYPRVNVNSGNQNRMISIQNQQQLLNDHQIGLMSLVNIEERQSKDNSNERLVLNRNVFNN